MKNKIKYWIKTSLHKDHSPQWDGVIGKEAMHCKSVELKAQGYKPVLDHSMTETLTIEID